MPHINHGPKVKPLNLEKPWCQKWCKGVSQCIKPGTRTEKHQHVDEMGVRICWPMTFIWSPSINWTLTNEHNEGSYSIAIYHCRFFFLFVRSLCLDTKTSREQRSQKESKILQAAWQDDNSQSPAPVCSPFCASWPESPSYCPLPRAVGQSMLSVRIPLLVPSQFVTHHKWYRSPRRVAVQEWPHTVVSEREREIDFPNSNTKCIHH